ncbi:MAG: triphosphoribosyl-dephospho-CoA synthase [Prevotella sp.]|nr:triphosphoribosyl-dephospho-CoA synthase [Prevotella sp.]
MEDYEIHSIPLSVSVWRRKVERFLEASQLRLDEVDYYAVVTDSDESEILAGGGLQGDIIKCIAVSEHLRDAHLSNALISHLISEAAHRGYQSVKVFTKPQNQIVFESLGFRLIGEAPLAILMENGKGIGKYKKYLQQIAQNVLTENNNLASENTSGNSITTASSSSDKVISETSSGNSKSLAPCPLPLAPNTPLASETGIIVMNANPFTLGHRYLIQQAARQVGHLFVIPVKENRSLFPYAERKAMIEAGCKDLENVTICEGSDYAISAATFPTYFLKQLSDATDTQMLLDIDVFARHIAPALGASVRFVGSEPNDALTRRYNELMLEKLPCVKVIERSKQNGQAVSASLVRKALSEGRFAEASVLVPPTTLPYLLAQLACDALLQELNTTPKPGLVDCHDNGAHKDMDFKLMIRSINALRPFFVQLAQAGLRGDLSHATISTIGIEAEEAMLKATHGVNTHRGALFSMGLAVAAAASQGCGAIHANRLQTTIAQIAQTFPDTKDTHGSNAVSQYQAKGALAMAREGYQLLFSDWMEFYRGERRGFSGEWREESGEWRVERGEWREESGERKAQNAELKTLLRIMSQLDDTNILHRCGPEVGQRVKAEAAAMLNDFCIEKIEAMNQRYSNENISPGGAADMLALTIFIYNITAN